jgi:four helix bundle protein
MTKTNRANNYDLEERTYQFAKNVALFCRKLPKTISNIEYSKQDIKASSSVGANYIEANESLSKKDFIMRIKISRKESKESVYWLRLIVDTNLEDFRQEGLSLKEEAIELKKIFSSIIEKA